MLRNFAIAFTTVAALALAANLQAQGPGGGPGRGRGMGGMMGGMMGGPGGGMLMLLQNEKVQKEIELDADQKEKIQKLAAETRETMRSRMGDMSNLSREERQTKMTEMRKEMQEEAAKTQKKVEGILLPKQLERIKQIQLQLQGVMALANPEVAKELGLTDDQKAKIKSINEEAMKARREMFAGGRPSAEDREKMTKAREENETKLMDVLTADQKEKLEKMKGEKFDVSALRGGFGGGGRRGNRGGNGGGGPVN